MVLKPRVYRLRQQRAITWKLQIVSADWTFVRVLFVAGNREPKKPISKNELQITTQIRGGAQQTSFDYSVSSVAAAPDLAATSAGAKIIPMKARAIKTSCIRVSPCGLVRACPQLNLHPELKLFTSHEDSGGEESGGRGIPTLVGLLSEFLHQNDTESDIYDLSHVIRE